MTEDINNLIARWHDGEGNDGQPLHEFLQLTWEEYSTWVEGGRLPEGCWLYDGVRRKLREVKGRELLALEKKAQRRARGRLAKLHRSDYQRLFNECMKELREEAKDGAAGGGVQDQ